MVLIIKYIVCTCDMISLQTYQRVSPLGPVNDVYQLGINV